MVVGGKGTLWLFVALFELLWLVVGVSDGASWRKMGGSGWLWLVVAGCGWLWLVVALFGWLWLVVGVSGGASGRKMGK